MDEHRKDMVSSCGADASRRIDYLLWGTLGITSSAYFARWIIETPPTSLPALPAAVYTFAGSIFDLVNQVWWGIALGMFSVGLLSQVRRELVVSLFGKTGWKGVVKAAVAGVLLDLCSHGILMIGAKLYERGVSVGQIMAFLIASPWNSLSLTIILIALIGFQWTLVLIVLSMLIGVTTGLIFNYLCRRQWLPENPYAVELPKDFRFRREASAALRTVRPTPGWWREVLSNGIKDSRMVIRWILFGIIVAALIRAFVPTEHFETYLGPSLAGLFLTLGIATILEICSEGSAPIAAEFFTRAKAPGNGFLFLTAGVATDYTEIMILKDTTGSWKIALMLPLITVPQIIFIAWLINNLATA